MVAIYLAGEKKRGTLQVRNSMRNSNLNAFLLDARVRIICMVRTGIGRNPGAF